MSWKYEIYRAIFVTLGTTEVITNLIYLMKKDGLKLAKKQHGELPPNITEKQLFIKVILMAMFGILFFISGIYFYIIKTFSHSIAFTILLLFSIYAILEAIYYRYWKTTGFCIVAVTLFLVYIFT